MAELEQLFSRGGLALHEVSVGSGRQEVLGNSMNCSRQATWLTSKRLHRLYKSTSALVRRKRTTGIVLEVVTGHRMFCALIDRRLLSICSAVYMFIRSCYATLTPIWPSVKYELQTFRDLMIFLVSPWRLPWCSMVTSIDSCLFGFGVTRANWPIEVVEKFGRVTERLSGSDSRTCHKGQVGQKL